MCTNACTWFNYSTMQRIREGIHIRTMKAKRKVEEISKEDVQAFLKKNAFVLFTVGAVIVGVYAHFIHSENCQCNGDTLPHEALSAGIILGFTLRPYKMTYREVKYFSFPGELLMRMLQMLVLPLLISSLITGTPRSLSSFQRDDLAERLENFVK